MTYDDFIRQLRGTAPHVVTLCAKNSQGDIFAIAVAPGYEVGKEELQYTYTELKNATRD